MLKGLPASRRARLGLASEVPQPIDCGKNKLSKKERHARLHHEGRFVIETYCTFTYPGFFDSDDILSNIVEEIRNTGKQNPACELLDEIDDIHDYSRDHHRGDDPAGDATDPLDLKELTAFVQHTLKIVNAIPNLP
jgi:hypothetical protein